eukprot:142751-Pyramimonas_sp.AAC.1
MSRVPGAEVGLFGGLGFRERSSHELRNSFGGGGAGEENEGGATSEGGGGGGASWARRAAWHSGTRRRQPDRNPTR